LQAKLKKKAKAAAAFFFNFEGKWSNNTAFGGRIFFSKQTFRPKSHAN